MCPYNNFVITLILLAPLKVLSQFCIFVYRANVQIRRNSILDPCRKSLFSKIISW